MQITGYSELLDFPWSLKSSYAPIADSFTLMQAVAGLMQA